MGQYLLKEEEIQLLIKLYKEGNSLLSVSKILKRDRLTIRSYLLRNGISINSSKKYKKYSLDENYFENIDTSDKAYFLGLIVADGCNTGKGLSISLQEKDYKILELFKKTIKYTGILEKKPKKCLNCQDSSYLRINSLKLKYSIEKWGVIQNKTHFTYFPDIPQHLHSHFIRGVFDGDGCIYKSRSQLGITIAGTEHLLSEIQKHLINNCNLKLLNLRKTISEGIFVLAYGGNKQIKRIYEYLYKDCGDFYINRKKEKFETNSL